MPPNGYNDASRRRPPSSATEESIDSINSYEYQPPYHHGAAPPQSRPSLQSRRPSPTNFGQQHGGAIIMNKTFQKLISLLLLIVIFDVYYLWDFFHDIDANANTGGTEYNGPEAGIHRLHDSPHGSSGTRRVVGLLRQLQNGLHNINIVRSASSMEGSEDTFDNLTDEEKVIELENEIYEWKNKYEEAMHRLHENPYPNGPPNIPFTPRPPNREDTYVFQKAKKSRAELAKMDTFGVHEKMVKILHAAQVEIDKDLADQLPTWDQVVSLYGDKPIIHGLETCEPYRKAVRAEDRMTGPAGMFNTGTNLLYELLKVNCDIKEARRKFREPKRNGMRWQVPWGKHNPPTTHRFRNIAKAWGKGIKQGDFFPIVLIKDPYTWMGSQCRHKYATYWGHDDEHCPNLVRWMIPDAIVPSEVRVKFALQMKAYISLLDVWNKWYEEWESMDFPHITTRFEDLLFHGEEVTKVACECVGGVFAKEFQYVEDSAKKAVGVHTGANGLVKAMLHYGDPEKRLNGFTDRDRIYAKDHVNYNLMKRYSYTVPLMPGEIAPPTTTVEHNEEEEEARDKEDSRRDDEKRNVDNGNEEEEEDIRFKNAMEERGEQEELEDKVMNHRRKNGFKNPNFVDEDTNEEERERRNLDFDNEETKERDVIGFSDEESAEDRRDGLDLDREEGDTRIGYGDEEDENNNNFEEEERNDRFDYESEEDRNT
jgi:hypothetical protein